MSLEHYTLDPSARVLVTDLGLSVGNILRRAGLPGDLLTGGPATLTPQQYFALWDAIADEADDPQLPIRIGQAISVESFAPPIFAAVCSPNLNVAAARIARYKALIGPVRLVLASTESGLQLSLRWPPDHRPPEILTTTEIVWWVALVRLATRRRIVPVSVGMPLPLADAAALTDYLGVRPGSSDQVSVVFADRDAARPFLTSNEPMWDVFEPQLRHRLSELEAGATTSQRVRSALLEMLPSGRGTVERVAAELALSPRTLQRRLREEGTSFQAELNDTRSNLATHYLAQGGLSLTEIAFLLGYDEPNSFHRAYRTWTGRTPQQARAELGV